MRSADLAEGMIMFPTAPVQQAAADLLIGDPPEQQMGPVCAWLEAPTVIGTNTCGGWSEEHFILLLPGAESTCDQLERRYGRPTPAPDHSRMCTAAKAEWQAYYNEFCRNRARELPEGGTFEMQMTLVLRFSSANSGSGMVYFEGETDRAKFAASAPVRLSR